VGTIAAFQTPQIYHEYQFMTQLLEFTSGILEAHIDLRVHQLVIAVCTKSSECTMTTPRANHWKVTQRAWWLNKTLLQESTSDAVRTWSLVWIKAFQHFPFVTIYWHKLVLLSNCCSIWFLFLWPV